MRRLEPSDLLALWEAGTALHPIDRALEILRCAGGPPDAARLPLGTRDALLLQARAATLGDRLEASEHCPACAERVELTLSCRALIDGVLRPPERWLIEQGDVRMVVRPLDSTDAAVAAAAADVDAAAAALLARAVVSAERAGEPMEAEALDGDAVAAVTASLAERDSAAELLVELTCPACSATWRRVLDVAGFVWMELAARAERLLGEVHRLAGAYGWTEDEIVRLGPARRAAYLAMVQG
jgi:hypothetical protein